MDYSRSIMCMYRLEAAVRSPRIVDPYCCGNSDVLTIYHYSQVGMNMKGGGFGREAREREMIAPLLVDIEGDPSYYDRYKDSQQNDEPWYPSSPILLWPAH